MFDAELNKPLWSIWSWVKDDDLAVSPAALEGADIWCERTVFREIFMSERLVAALNAAKIKIDFVLSTVRIGEAAQ